MAWLYLLAAILLEVTGTSFMKLSQGFTRLVPSLMLFVFYGLSFICRVFVLKTIDVSVAYAVWSGLGTALITVVGSLFFQEPLNSLKLISLCLVILGVIGLNIGGMTQ